MILNVFYFASFQVITKLLYLLNQGETFTKVTFLFSRLVLGSHSFEDPCFLKTLVIPMFSLKNFDCVQDIWIKLVGLSYCLVFLLLTMHFCINVQTEATEVFFSVTKLFQSRDIGLRRMVYLMIKELSPSADEVTSLMDLLSLS